MAYREALTLLLLLVYTDSNFAFHVDSSRDRHGDHTRDAVKPPHPAHPHGNKPSLDCLLMTDIITDFTEGDPAFLMSPVEDQTLSDVLGFDIFDPEELQKFACSLVEVTSLSELADLIPVDREVLEGVYLDIMNGMVDEYGGPLGLMTMYKSMRTVVYSSFIDIFPQPQIPLQSNDDISLQDVETFIKRMVRNFGHYPFKDLYGIDEGPFIDNPESAAEAFYESTSLEDLANRLDQPVEPFEQIWSYFNEMPSRMPIEAMREFMTNIDPIVSFVGLSYRLGLLELDI